MCRDWAAKRPHDFSNDAQIGGGLLRSPIATQGGSHRDRASFQIISQAIACQTISRELATATTAKPNSRLIPTIRRIRPSTAAPAGQSSACTAVFNSGSSNA